MKQSVLVCGATGFIGRNIAERLALSGQYEVHAVRFNRPEFTLPNTTWHQCDLRDPAAVEKLVKGKDIIIQAAATTSGAKDIVTKPFIHVTDNAVMNSYLFRSAFEAKVKQVVFFSCTVMYPSSEKPLKETDFDANKPLHPRYFGVGNTKIYVEKMCEFFAGISETKFTAIRHSNMYGPHDKYDLDRSHFFGATVTKVMQAVDKMTVWGTGEEERDLLHVDDLTDFVIAAMKNQKEKYRLYNCGLGKAHSVLDVVKMIIAASGKNLKIEHDLTAPTIKTSLCLDCGLAEKELGWKPKIALQDGIRSTIAWWREHIDPATLKLKEGKKAA